CARRPGGIYGLDSW
nr:immunoglobulin heavy chain junction region [Macaca mulatta]MOW87083.1 immunoglobulin heavy chain junction region [Macaca mulatta]